MTFLYTFKYEQRAMAQQLIEKAPVVDLSDNSLDIDDGVMTVQILHIVKNTTNTGASYWQGSRNSPKRPKPNPQAASYNRIIYIRCVATNRIAAIFVKTKEMAMRLLRHAAIGMI